jgi:hypothetical protein
LIYPDELEIIWHVCLTSGYCTYYWLNDKCNYFNFAIVIFPFLCSNIPLSPVYGVYIISPSWLYTQEHAMRMRAFFFKEKSTTDEKVDVAKLQQISFKVIILQILRSLWCPCFAITNYYLVICWIICFIFPPILIAVLRNWIILKAS